jgi:Tfp pilus assembly protein PilN
MRAVNLLPRDAVDRKSIRQEDPAVVIGSALGVIVIFALGIGFLSAHSRASSEEQKLHSTQIALGKLSLEREKLVTPKTPTSTKPTKPIIPVPAVTAEEQPRLQAVSTALAGRIAWDRVLREFSLVVPDDVTVSSLALNAPSAAGASTTSAGGGMVISGNAYSYDSVARLLSRLMLIPDLTDVTLTSSTGDQNGGVTFGMSAAIKGAEPAAPATTSTPTTATTDTTTTGSSS